jgi:hypothetical protein
MHGGRATERGSDESELFEVEVNMARSKVHQARRITQAVCRSVHRNSLLEALIPPPVGPRDPRGITRPPRESSRQPRGSLAGP